VRQTARRAVRDQKQIQVIDQKLQSFSGGTNGFPTQHFTRKLGEALLIAPGRFRAIDMAEFPEG
jgi:hypothetical protein